MNNNKYIYIILLIVSLITKLHAQKTVVPNIPAPQSMAVNSYTGNLFFQRNEQSLRGTGFRIYQSYYYNAATDTLNYGYGHGWSFYYNIYYREVADSIIIYHADANKDVYLFRNGSYKSPLGIFDVLTKTGNQLILKSKDGTKHIFADPSHKKVTRIEDKNNNYVNIEYTGAIPTRILNSSGRSLLLTWQNGLLKEAKDESDVVKKYTYQYNNAKDLVTVIDALGGRKNFSYKNHRLTQVSDQNNNPIVISYYDNGGKVRQITSCNSEQRFSYLTNPHKTFVTQKSDVGNVVNGYIFDDNQHLTAFTDPEGNRSELKYDENSNLVQWTDLQGAVTHFEYDANGNLTKEIDPVGNISQFTFENTYNNPLTYRNKKGALTTLTYDSKGNLTTITKPNNTTEIYTYDAAGKVLSHKNANNNTTNYQYNTNGDLISIQYPTGTVQLEYNGSCCNVGKITDPNGNTTEMTYDVLNRVKTVKDKAGNTIAYDYDAVGNLIKETDPVGNVKEYFYDALNRLISVKLPVGTWYYSYDGQGNLTKMTDANGHSTTYEYDKKKRLKKETDPLGNATAYNYDLNGNLIQRLDPNNNVVNYKYDLLNRLTEKSFTGNTDKFAYDEEGNIVSAFNNDIAYTFEYDDLNRLLKKNILTWNKSLNYTYDAEGNRKTMTDHDGGLTTYNYDSNNRLINLTNPSNLTTSFEYDAGGRMKKQINGNGTFTTYHYDLAGRMDSLINWKNNTEKISFFYYTFDQFGNRKTLTDKRGLNTYNYDGSYRLTSVTYPDGSTESFSFDGTGNRTIRTKNGVTTNYTYNAADQIQTAGNKGFTFDANGNTTQQTGNQPKIYKYDGENRLTEAIFPSQRKAQFKYDPFGDKIEKIDTLAQITKMLYDEDNILAEINRNNSTQEYFTSAMNMDTWLSLSKNSSTSFYHRDGLNSIVELTDMSKNNLNQYQYDIYGSLVFSSESIDNDLLFIGRSFEESIGLYDVRARFYNPEIGNFTSRDSFEGIINNPLSLNKYNYSFNSPTNLIDQNGNFPTSDLVWFTGGVIVGIAVGEGALIAAGVGATLGAAQGLYDTYKDPNANQTWQCYLSNAGQGAGLGLIPIGGALKKLGLNNLFRKLDILGKRSNYNSELGRIVKTVPKYWKPQGVVTKINNQGVGILAGYGAEFGIGSEISDAAKWARNLLPDDPCKPPMPPGSKDPMPNSPSGDPIKIPIVTPVDPNEIIGPTGIDSLKWVSVKQNLPYKILFENDPDFATAPAQNVTVYLPIHPKLNPASLRISDFGFGSFDFTVPQNTSIYTNRLDLRDSLGLYVDITAGLDIANRRAFWIFQSIDPETGLTSTLPANKGFLPVNDSLKHNGEGYVTFTIIPSSLAQTRDSVTAQAQIIFDTEESIKTNTWVNIIDAVGPSSKVDTVYAIGGNTARVTFSGHDDRNGVGVDFYDLYVSQDDGEFLLNQSKLKGTTFDFKGNPNSTYKFYTIATDSVGNREASKFSSNKSIFLGISPPTLAASKDTACTGENIILTASNCTGFVTWSTGQTGSNITVNITENAGFTANCTVNQITSNESDSLKIVWRGTPPTSTLIGTQTIISSQSATLTANFTGLSPWSFVVNGQNYANIVTNPYTFTVSPTKTTTYRLTSVSNRCTTIVNDTTNNLATVTVNPQTIKISPISSSPICAGTTLNLNFTVTGTFASGNVFTAQLSDKNGLFTSPIVIGTLADTTSGILPIIIPTNTTTGTGYRIRIVSSNPSIIGGNNGTDLTVNAIPTILANSNSPVCLGSNLQLNSIGGNTYLWSGPNSFSSTLQNPLITLLSNAEAGNYTVKVITIDGCTNLATTSVTINQPPVITASSNSPICANSSLNLSSNGGNTYLWNGPNSYSSTLQNPIIDNVPALATGIYTIKVTSTTGCTNTATINVLINPLPAVTASSNSPICETSNLQLSANSGYIYKWTGQNSFSSTLQNPTINNATPLYSGIYTVSVTSTTGCINTATTSIYVGTTPATPTTQADVQIYLGVAITLTATGCAGSSGIYNLKWYESANNSLVSMPVYPLNTRSYYATCEHTSNGLSCISAKSNDVLVTVITSSSIIISIKTGDWQSSSTWDLGRVPQSGDVVIIDQNHLVTLDGIGVAKDIKYNANGKLIMKNLSSELKTGK